MGCSCLLSYLEDDLPEIEILYVDKATKDGIRAYTIVDVFLHLWEPGSVNLAEGEVEDEYNRTMYFTVQQILGLKDNRFVGKHIDWAGLEHLLKTSPAKNKRFYFWFAT